MDDRIKRTIDRLNEVNFDGMDGNERLSAICTVLYQPEYGWTRDACERLREILIDWLEQYDPDEWADGYLAEQGLVRLPKDGRGEVIHVGDTVVYVDCDSERGDVTSIEYGSDCVTVVVDHGHAEMEYKPQELRHYHKPTAVDVLREFLSTFLSAAEDAMRKGYDKVPDEIYAKYAAKLREVMADE